MSSPLRTFDTVRAARGVHVSSRLLILRLRRERALLTPPGGETVAGIADRSPKRAATRLVVIFAALGMAILALVGLLAFELIVTDILDILARREGGAGQSSTG